MHAIWCTVRLRVGIKTWYLQRHFNYFQNNYFWNFWNLTWLFYKTHPFSMLNFVLYTTDIDQDTHFSRNVTVLYIHWIFISIRMSHVNPRFQTTDVLWHLGFSWKIPPTLQPTPLPMSHFTYLEPLLTKLACMAMLCGVYGTPPKVEAENPLLHNVHWQSLILGAQPVLSNVGGDELIRISMSKNNLFTYIFSHINSWKWSTLFMLSIVI